MLPYSCKRLCHSLDPGSTLFILRRDHGAQQQGVGRAKRSSLAVQIFHAAGNSKQTLPILLPVGYPACLGIEDLGLIQIPFFSQSLRLSKDLSPITEFPLPNTEPPQGYDQESKNKEWQNQ